MHVQPIHTVQELHMYVRMYCTYVSIYMYCNTHVHKYMYVCMHNCTYVRMYRPVGWEGALGAFAPPFLVEKAT